MGVNLKLYVDGSYSVSSEVSGGWVLLSHDESVLLAQRVISKNPGLTSAHNVGGELLATVSGLAQAIRLLKVRKITNVPVTITIYHDYIGIERFIQGHPTWKAKQPASIFYVNCFNTLMCECSNVKVVFKKVKAHTGVYWNEVADAIAGDHIPAEVSDHLLVERVV